MSPPKGPPPPPNIADSPNGSSPPPGSSGRSRRAEAEGRPGHVGARSSCRHATPRAGRRGPPRAGLRPRANGPGPAGARRGAPSYGPCMTTSPTVAAAARAARHPPRRRGGARRRRGPGRRRRRLVHRRSSATTTAAAACASSSTSRTPTRSRALRAVAEAVAADLPVHGLAAVHRTGLLAVGDVAVVVAASARPPGGRPSRRPAGSSTTSRPRCRCGSGRSSTTASRSGSARPSESPPGALRAGTLPQPAAGGRGRVDVLPDWLLWLLPRAARHARAPWRGRRWSSRARGPQDPADSVRRTPASARRSRRRCRPRAAAPVAGTHRAHAGR